MKLVNGAAHVDFVDRLRLPTNSTIAWTTLRVAHTIHKPTAAIFSVQLQRQKDTAIATPEWNGPKFYWKWA